MNQAAAQLGTIEAVREAFSDALEATMPRPGTVLVVHDVAAAIEGSGDGIEIRVQLKMPNGELMTLIAAGSPYLCGDADDPDGMLARLQEWTGLSPAAVRRRLRKAGFVKPLVAEELEEI